MKCVVFTTFAPGPSAIDATTRYGSPTQKSIANGHFPYREKYVPGSTLRTVMSMPAAFAFWASTWHASTMPAAIGEVTSSSLRFD